MDIDDIILAIKEVANCLKTPSGNITRDDVKKFQEKLYQKLSINVNGYKWYTEVLMMNGMHSDRADIYGGKELNDYISINGQKVERITQYQKEFNICKKTCNDDWIIELDALRIDQVASKFLSRLALLGLSDKAIHYVAILYPNKHKNVKGCIKYGKYAFEVMKSIDNKSMFDLIIIQPQKNYLEHIILTQQYFKVKYKKKALHTKSKNKMRMTDVAELVVKDYCGRNKNLKYSELSDKFLNYVSNKEENNSYRNIGIKLKYGEEVYVFTQWRNSYDSQNNWTQFVKVIDKLNYSVVGEFKTTKITF